MSYKFSYLKFLRRGAALLLAAAVVLACGAPVAGTGAAIDAKKDESKDIDDTLGDVRRRIYENRGENEQLIDEQRELDIQKAAEDAEYEALAGLLRQYEEQIYQADLAYEEAVRNCGEQRELLTARVRSMYMNDGETVLESLLSSKDITGFLEIIELFSTISSHDNEILEDYKLSLADVEYKRSIQISLAEQTGERVGEQRRAVDELNLSKAELEDKIQKLQYAIDTLESYEDKLEEQSLILEEEIRGLVAKAEAEAAEAARRAAAEKAAAEKAAREAAAKEAAAKAAAAKKNAEKTPAAGADGQAADKGAKTATVKSGSGELRWPLPSSRTISSAYGKRTHPIKKKVLNHSGIDIAAPSGSAIIAAKAGKVIISRSEPGYGNTVVIDHGGGVTTLYGHCSKLLVKSGQSVKAGANIAKVGSTGVSTGPHLHFEVRKNGSPVNPMNYL